MGKKSLKGQSLIEVVFAVSIIGLILAGFVSAIFYFSKASQVSKSGSKAGQLAQEKIEQLRAEKKSDPTLFWENMSNFASATPTPESLNDGKYERSLSVDYSQPDGSNRRAEVEVTLSWKEQDQNKEVKVKSYFSEY